MLMECNDIAAIYLLVQMGSFKKRFNKHGLGVVLKNWL